MTYDYLILTEKSSEYDAFIQALGGKTGNFNGHSYYLVHSQGHLLELADPEDQVSPALKEQYKSWNLQYLPWNINEFILKKEIKKDKKGKNIGKPAKYAVKLLDSIKKASQQCRAIVIATDTDYSSGEGELLAWEIINQIGWHGPVYREYHDDESVEGIQRAMRKLKDISVQNEDGDYVKAEVRNKWDFASIQLTRAATSIVRDDGYYVKVVNEGRLKSVIITFVYKRLQAIKNYVKKPFYEVKFKDNQGHIYARKIDPKDEKKLVKVRHNDLSQAKQEQTTYQTPQNVVEVKNTLKSQAPKTLIDMSKIDGLLSKKGYPSKMIKSVYQTLYEAKYLSYPRTSDKTITPEQFDELVANRKKIASVVGVDLNLLTHLEGRKNSIKKAATHGANRPGHKIPHDLNEIRNVFGSASKQTQDCAADMYKLVAKSALAILGEDYQYYQVTAHLSSNPEFITSFDVPAKYNYKRIYGFLKDKQVNPIGNVASSFIYEGANPKPSAPTKEWVYRKLNSYKYSIGQAATQQSTMASLTDKSSNAYLLSSDKKGHLGLTEQGLFAALIAMNTYIASPQVTVQLFQAMQAVGKFKLPPDALLDTVNQVVQHDLPIMSKNIKLVEQVIAKPKKKDPGDYCRLNYEGKEINLKRTWGEHTFTDQELATLATGNPITFKYKGRDVSGKLGPNKYHGKTYINFIPDFKQKRKRGNK